ncbi:DUF3667 domain-containing protein [Oleiagrimonas sp. C23AA]|uniref:DUF3667 domain-containing protein n=1 Tax=Oleiagrimonas sp. C23AA TaxID=2719047 RepID=UPI001421FBA3|nr:DUF3667 domain-containing protein [Oleiagrimonas sp. C23AA]NII11974.1 DUF3667 domain-containing protein [Oleiagrimonas sp. C23AA]
MNDLTPFEGLHCANCGYRLQGEFCHHCGQSTHSVLKPIHGIAEEAVETLLHIDSRILHTLPRLYLRPGFLTMEYFAGRRVRYIAPFRLMFVLCLLAFFALHWSVDHLAEHGDLVNAHVQLGTEAFQQAHTPTQVRTILARQLQALDSADALAVMSPTARAQLQRSRHRLFKQANQRLAKLGAPPLKPTTGESRPAAAPGSHASATGTWMHIDWLPDIVNARLERIGRHIQGNWQTLQHGDAQGRHEAQQRMIDGVFGTLPQALFVMVPLFAVLLKLFYLFQRRLYMEHLIVALHSHAFLFLSLLLGMILEWLAGMLVPHAHWLAPAFGLLGWVLFLWIPVYLLCMQKRIYRQSWPWSTLKFLCIGWLYLWMLMGVLVIAVILGLAH